MKRLFIIGAGGLGREVVDIVRSSTRWSGADLAFIDDAVPVGTVVQGVPVVGSCSMLHEVLPDGLEICVAVGNPTVRQRLVKLVEECGLTFATIVDPSAVVRPSVALGTGVIVSARSFLSCNVVVGAHAVINPGAILGHDVKIGPCAVVGGGAVLSGGAQIGEGAMVGAGASILGNTVVGGGATVGMGSAVYASVDQNLTVIGNPARAIPVMRTQSTREQPQRN